MNIARYRGGLRLDDTDPEDGSLVAVVWVVARRGDLRGGTARSPLAQCLGAMAEGPYATRLQYAKIWVVGVDCRVEDMSTCLTPGHRQTLGGRLEWVQADRLLQEAEDGRSSSQDLERRVAELAMRGQTLATLVAHIHPPTVAPFQRVASAIHHVLRCGSWTDDRALVLPATLAPPVGADRRPASSQLHAPAHTTWHEHSLATWLLGAQAEWHGTTGVQAALAHGRAVLVTRYLSHDLKNARDGKLLGGWSDDHPSLRPSLALTDPQVSLWHVLAAREDEAWAVYAGKTNVLWRSLRAFTALLRYVFVAVVAIVLLSQLILAPGEFGAGGQRPALVEYEWPVQLGVVAVFLALFGYGGFWLRTWTRRTAGSLPLPAHRKHVNLTPLLGWPAIRFTWALWWAAWYSWRSLQGAWQAPPGIHRE